MDDLKSRAGRVGNQLVHKLDGETMVIEPWGRDGLRVRVTTGPEILDTPWALSEPVVKVDGAVIEISEEPHTGCSKFAQRFGHDALRFISTPTGQGLRLRGVNTRVIQSGPIRIGDTATKRQP